MRVGFLIYTWGFVGSDSLLGIRVIEADGGIEPDIVSRLSDEKETDCTVPVDRRASRMAESNE